MRRLLLAALLPLLPAPALALDPDGLLAIWEAQARAMGAPMFPPFLREGDTARLPGLGPDGTGSLTLRPTGDGGVAVEVAIPEAGVMPFEDGHFAWNQRGVTLVARDGSAPGAVRYEATVPSLQLIADPPADSANDPGGAVEIVDGTLAIEVPGPQGGRLGIDLQAAGLGYLLHIVDGSGMTRSVQDLTGRSQQMTVRGAVTLPPSLAPERWAELGALSETAMQERLLQALAEGLAVSFDGTTAGSTTSGTLESPVLSYAYTMTAGPTSTRAGASLAGASGGTAVGDLQVSVTSPMLPAPVGVSLDRMELALDLPFSARPAPFVYRLDLAGLAADEAAWALVDPEGRLPHDPASLGFEIGGALGLDLAATIRASMAGTPPPEPQVGSVELRRATVSALGASASATGRIAFPRGLEEPPQGRASITLTGVNGLLDAAEAINLLAPGEITQARMGLAMAFEPAGDDVLTAQVEMGADGSVTVNGQRMQ